MTGRLIAFEGGEASGKSTQARLLAERLGAVLTHEPGGTPIGLHIRALLLDPATVGLSDRAEALLMAADRAQHVAELVLPTLAAGDDVVTDRFIDSSLAYQGFGRGLPVEELRWLSRWATGGLEPDVVVLLDVSEAVATARLRRSRDRLEAAGDAFHEAVRAGFRTLAAEAPDRWVVVDGVGEIDDVAARVSTALASRLSPSPVLRADQASVLAPEPDPEAGASAGRP